MTDRRKYRVRTGLRGRLPGSLSWLAPKGRRDCGAHEWYRSDEGTWRCYHCAPAIMHNSPWSAEEETRIRLAALVQSLQVLSAKPLTAEVVREEERLLQELSESIAREAELVGA